MTYIQNTMKFLNTNLKYKLNVMNILINVYRHMLTSTKHHFICD